MMEKITIWTILLLFSVSSILIVAETLGFLPKKFSRCLNRNRIQLIVDVLNEFGINNDTYKRKNISNRIKSYFDDNDFLDSLKENLSTSTLQDSFLLGRTETVPSDKYINLMGASTNPEGAELFARYLSTYWKKILQNKDEVKRPDFDFIVTPKNGSPILGYEFSKLLNKELVLHNTAEKFKSDDYEYQKKFDSLNQPKKGSVALILDDSTTGGRMVMQVIEDLRRNGFIVEDCLVVFEPTLKNARAKLKEMDVALHSIVKT